MHIAIIGGGPAGLRAAEIAVTAGARVTLFDSKASVGRKFLVAGRGGLNLTHEEPREAFIARYSGPPKRWASLIDEGNSEALRGWAAGYGVETFVASTGRVYPRELKAAPLLRRWVQRLRGLGVRFVLHHEWVGLEHGGNWTLKFQAAGELQTETADRVILALGGASWPETGSTGTWTAILTRLGVTVTPWHPANCGWECAWPAAWLASVEGQPLKNVVARAGTATVRGELLITRYGLEGGAIYQLGPALRTQASPHLVIDLKPDNTVAQLVAKFGPIQRNFLAEARTRWRLSSAAHALLDLATANEQRNSAEAIATAAKNCVLPLQRPRPIAEAISSAGGVAWNELDENLMIQRLPGIFVAGEMIDWEAPTGGYLLQGCFATGTRAARGALNWKGA
jgi:uncharacterized flavoprotein (TIGR03862 family)